MLEKLRETHLHLGLVINMSCNEILESTLQSFVAPGNLWG